MDQQFQAWGMTAAEREVGLLILKGLSHKEIAALRATTDATVRQQAQSIYRKAGLPGKTAFSAYFLEDLFVPAGVANDLHARSPHAGSTGRTRTALWPPNASSDKRWTGLLSGRENQTFLSRFSSTNQPDARRIYLLPSKRS